MNSARDLECPRCHVHVEVAARGNGIALSYDMDQWNKKCCCRHLDEPLRCCSFLELESVIRTLASHGATIWCPAVVHLDHVLPPVEVRQVSAHP